MRPPMGVLGHSPAFDSKRLGKREKNLDKQIINALYLYSNILIDKFMIRKTSLTFEEEADLLKSLGHPTRLKILQLLQEEEQCVKNIWERLGLNQANVSQHLAMMKHKGILAAVRKGGTMCYSIKDPRAIQILNLMRPK
jgi:ArsR family transcriptional regulator